MFLIQLLLPIRSSKNSRADLLEIEHELTDRFGGVTSYRNSPAKGLWEDPEERDVAADIVVIVEVMVEELDRTWWKEFRSKLEKRLSQKEIIIRALGGERI